MFRHKVWLLAAGHAPRHVAVTGLWVQGRLLLLQGPAPLAFPLHAGSTRSCTYLAHHELESVLIIIIIIIIIYSIIKQELYRPARNQGARLQYLIDDGWALGNNTSKLQCKWASWPAPLITKQRANNVMHQQTWHHMVHAWISISMRGLSEGWQLAHNPCRLPRKAEQAYSMVTPNSVLLEKHVHQRISCSSQWHAHKPSLHWVKAA